MRIIIDAMGGDNAPEEIVRGALEAAKDFGVDITLVGKGEEILRVAERMGLNKFPRGVEIVNATDVIDMDDDPTAAMRTKKDSSMVVGFTLLRDGRGDAFVSAGNTGAILAGATLIVKRVRGIRRAAMAPIIPNTSGGFILIDCGANSECTPEYLLQFAHMGSLYAQDALKLQSPRVGLLNIGSERTKGTTLQVEAYDLLEKAAADGGLNFIGNVEPKEVMNGVCDVLVCDGFTGNVLLKALEGVAGFIMAELKALYLRNIVTKLSALVMKKHVGGLKAKLNPDTIGGTAMLGISKPVLKAHGSSNAMAIRSAISQAMSSVESNFADRLLENVDRMKIGENTAE